MGSADYALGGRIRRPHEGTNSAFRVRMVDALFKGAARTELMHLEPDQREQVIAATLRIASQRWMRLGAKLTDEDKVLVEGWINRKLPLLAFGDEMMLSFPGGFVIIIDWDWTVTRLGNPQLSYLQQDGDYFDRGAR